MRRAAPRVLPALVVVAATVAWVLFMPRAMLVGDDLKLVTVLHDVKWPDALVEALTSDGNGSDKYRPVLETLLRVIVPLFGANIHAYVTLNALVELASALTLLSIALRLTRGRVLLSTLAACAFVVCRFTYYNLIQIYGVMEGVAILLMLLAVRAVVIGYQDRRPRALWSTVWLVALAIFTDERYLAVVPFFIAAALVCPESRTQARVTGRVALGHCIAPALYIVVRTFVFRSPLAVGTGGSAIHLQAASVQRFFAAAVENMLGFNAGNAYFSGRDLSDLGAPAYVAGALVCVPLIALAGWYALDVVRRRAPVMPLVLALLLFVPLLLTTTITIRQEFRWLYGPFALVVLGLAAGGGRWGPRSIPHGLALCALIASIGGALYYRQFAANVFFVHDMAVAGAVRDALLADPAQRVVVAVHRDLSIEGWAFQRQTFFRANGLDGSRVRFVNEPEDAADETGRVALLSTQMTAAGVARVEVPRLPVVPFHGVRLSFESAFPKGIIAPARSTAAPGGRGAFLFPHAGEAVGMSSLTVLSGFRCTFRNVAISRMEHLMFYVAQPTPVGAPSRAFVSIRASGRSTDVFSAILTPAGAEPAWRRQDIPLEGFAGRKVDVTFGAEPTTDEENAWVAYAEPSLVVMSR